MSGTVFCKIDFAPRFDKMQQHTGEHIVSGIIFKKYGYNNVGFHLADDEVTFDFDGVLTRSQLDEIEDMANNVIYQNRAVLCYYPEKEKLSGMEYRSKLDLTDNVRIVEIEGVDLCACCAPHVKNTGEVGIIKLLDVMSYKGGVRITMACGMRALCDYRKKYENLYKISKSLSAPINQTSEFFEKYTADTEVLKQSISTLRRELVTIKAGSVVPSDNNLIVFEDGLDAGMLRQYINLLSGKYSAICAVFTPNGNGYNFVAVSDTVDMRGVASKLREQICAKCGGSEKMIQGSTPSSKQEIVKIFDVD